MRATSKKNRMAITITDILNYSVGVYFLPSGEASEECHFSPLSWEAAFLDKKFKDSNIFRCSSCIPIFLSKNRI